MEDGPGFRYAPPVTGVMLENERHACASFDMFRDGPIIVQVIHPYATVDVHAAKETLRLGRLMTEERKSPMLVDLRAPCSVELAARTVFASAEFGEVFSAVALLTTNTVTRLAANLLLKINRPPYPAHMFSEEAEARAWLSEFMKT